MAHWPPGGHHGARQLRESAAHQPVIIPPTGIDRHHRPGWAVNRLSLPLLPILWLRQVIHRHHHHAASPRQQGIVLGAKGHVVFKKCHLAMKALAQPASHARDRIRLRPLLGQWHHAKPGETQARCPPFERCEI